MAGYMPSILCYERTCCEHSRADAWREHSCLVSPDAGMQDDPEAASAIAQEHFEAVLARGGDGSVEDFAMSLKDAGYVRLSDFSMAADNRGL